MSKLKSFIPVLLATLAGCTASTDNPNTEIAPPRVMVFRVAAKEKDRPQLSGLAFSPDGHLVAADTGTGLQIWRMADGKELPGARKEDERGQCSCLVFSPNGKLLAGAQTWYRDPINDARSCIRIWQFRDGKLEPLHLLCHDSVYLLLPAFSPDSKTIVAGDEMDNLVVWEAETGKEKLRFRGGVAADFTPDGNVMISVGHDGSIRRWKAGTRELLPGKLLCTDYLKVVALAFTRDRSQVAMTDQIAILIKDTRTGKTLHRFQPPGTVCQISYSPDERNLLIHTEDGYLLLSTETGAVAGWLKDKDWASGMTGRITPDGLALACTKDDSVVLHDLGKLLGCEPKTSDEPAIPLSGELIVKPQYVLDLGGLTPQEACDRSAYPMFENSGVELTLKLQNTSKDPIEIRRDSFHSLKPTFFLVGPGALNEPPRFLQTGIGPLGDGEVAPVEPPSIKLRPGEAFHLPVKSFGGKCAWVLPGVYSIYGNLSVNIFPAPKGFDAHADGSAFIPVGCSPVRVKVVAPAKPTAAPKVKPPGLPPLGQLVKPKFDNNLAALRNKLARLTSLGEPEESTLLDALRLLSERYDLTMILDEKAFKKVGKLDIAKTKVKLDRCEETYLHQILQKLLDQVGGTYQLRRDHVLVVPAQGNVREQGMEPIFAWQTARTWRKLNSLCSLQEKPRRMKLSEALQVLVNEREITFWLDAEAFQKAGKPNIAKTQVMFGNRNDARLREILQALLDQVGATFKVDREQVLIVPAR